MANLMITCPLCGQQAPFCNVQGNNLKFDKEFHLNKYIDCMGCKYKIECMTHKQHCTCRDWNIMYSEWIRTLQDNIELESIISEQQYEINYLKDIINIIKNKKNN